MDINEVLQGLSNLGGEMPREPNKRTKKNQNPQKRTATFVSEEGL